MMTEALWEGGRVVGYKAIIVGDEWLDWLKRAGIVSQADKSSVSRVVIDAKAGEAVRVYVEKYGTELMLQVEPPPIQHGVQILVLDGKEQPHGNHD